MARVEIVVGSNALSASLEAGADLIQLEQVGGFQTFASSSYNTARVPPPKIIRPDSDIATSNWSPLTLFSRIDEVVPDGATTEVTSTPISSLAPSSSLRIFEVGLSDLLSNNKVSAAAVSLTVAKSGSFSQDTGSLGDSTASLTVEVRQGVSVRATRTFAGIGTDFAAVNFNLSEAELSTVSQWDDVSIHAEFELSVSTGSSAVEGRVTQAQIQLTLSSIIEAPPVDNVVYRLTWGT